MGEVYRAKDPRLGRDVAVKVLPEEFFEGEERRARFEREARLLAAVNHPGIAAIYSFEESGGRDLLVMELCDGQTLAERLLKGPLPLDQLLKAAIEIASALDAAHRAGIVHRDLKPGNVMMTKSGVKLVDFGLAKASAQPIQPSTGTSFPTELPKNLTQQGTILGTFQYMAPEQLEGKDADARSDIFSFGAVLYEMATGKKAFEARSQASLIAAILQSDPPPISTIQPMTPPALDRVVKTCLAKEPDERWQNAHDLANELKWIVEGGSQAGAPAVVVSHRRHRERLAWALAALFALALGVSRLRQPAVGRLVTRVAIPMPAAESFMTDNYSTLTISPDGRRIVYVIRKDDKRHLVQRSLDAAEATAIPSTEGASCPFFSPDGQSVGFFADGKIRKVSLAGGVPIAVCEVGGPTDTLGASWGPDDTIVFPQKWGAALLRVPAAGGKPEPLTKLALKGNDRGHLWPELLPGGKAVLFTVFTGGSLEDYTIDVQSLVTGERKTLIKGGTFGRYAASGHILYVRGATLIAVPFDPVRLELAGTALPVAQGVYANTNGGAGYAVSGSGTLLYAPGGLLLLGRSLVWVDRQGHASPASGIKRPFGALRISPDGKRIALVVEAETYDIWVLDPGRDSLTRLSFGKDDGSPVWSPDGRRIAFVSSQAGASNLYVRASDGSGSEERLTSDEDRSFPMSFSPDGKSLVYLRDHGSAREIWLHSFEKGSAPRPLLQGPFRLDGGWLSPDGRWLAYVSNESGKDEVYVTAFPGPGGKWQISTDGGSSARWARDGREIFFRKDKKVMRVAVTTSPAFSASRPEVLFEGDYTEWDIAPDGKHFLMVKDETAASAPSHLNLVLNWFEELRARAPRGGK